MPEHESWCCRSPQSPCALEGGCSGSCNCGAHESIDSSGAGGDRPNTRRRWSDEEVQALRGETADGTRTLSWAGWDRIAARLGRTTLTVQAKGRRLAREARERLRLDVAAELYGAAFEPAAYNEYGSVVESGYKVENSTWPDAVRVSHKMPAANLFDPDRLSSGEHWRIRVEACREYAEALRAAGWQAADPVEKGGTSEPWLIVRRGTDA